MVNGKSVGKWETGNSLKDYNLGLWCPYGHMSPFSLSFLL